MREKPPANWYLEGFADDGRDIWRTAIRRLPFAVGRRADNDLVLRSPRVSLRHAEMLGRGDELTIRDSGSTNGTFLNGERVASQRTVRDGDVLHFADQEFRLVAAAPSYSTRTTQTMTLTALDPERRIFERQHQLRELLRDGGLLSRFQPMVRLATGEVLGYEILGYAGLGSEEVSPVELFEIAATLDLEPELSSAFRTQGIEQAARLSGDPLLFVKTHPSELDRPTELQASLERLCARHPDRRLVLEIHEQGMSNLSALQTLRADLESLRIGIAFDGFGTGQSRLLELIEAAPRYVKFDRTWIQDLDRASRQRLEMVETLVALVTEWRVATIAEGVERAEEAAVCADLGFEIAQGHFFGHPVPAPGLV